MAPGMRTAIVLLPRQAESQRMCQRGAVSSSCSESMEPGLVCVTLPRRKAYWFRRCQRKERSTVTHHVCVENRRFSFVISSALKVLQQPGGRVKVLQWSSSIRFHNTSKYLFRLYSGDCYHAYAGCCQKYFIIHC